MRDSNDDTVIVFKNQTRKNRLFFYERLLRCVQYPGRKEIDFLRDFKCLAHKMNPEELKDIQDHFVYQSFLEGINHRQFNLDQRKILEPKYLTED